MRVMAINSSPRGGGQSTTELMMTYLAKGMREAGAEVEVVHLRQKNIDYCRGCYTCWTRTPGKCVLRDDMTEELFPKWLESDLVVYATPLYHHSVNAAMKTFVERTLPVSEPFLEKNGDGRWRHPLRQRVPKAVLLSVAGFLEPSVFSELSHYAHYLWSRRLIAEIYRPASMALTQMPGGKARDVLEATLQAGRELVQSMAISPETMARITQPLDDTEALRRFANMFWRTCIAEGVTPRAYEQRGLLPRPGSVEDFMLFLPAGFNPRAAGDTRAILQFTFSGEVEGARPEADGTSEVEGSCYFTIQDGTIEAALGTADNADLTIAAPFEVWRDVVTGKADATQMLMEQKYSASGDISLLLKMAQLFSGPPGTEAEPLTKEGVMQDVTCCQIIAGMPIAFNAEAAEDLTAGIYFKVRGEEPGDYYLEISGGTCTFHEGAPASATLTIETPSEVWVAIATGELDGQQAFMEQKYTASGDMSLLMRLNGLFSAGE